MILSRDLWNRVEQNQCVNNLFNQHKLDPSLIIIYTKFEKDKDLTYPVHVVLTVVGVVVVDDKLDIIHMKTSSSDICSHQDGSVPVFNSPKTQYLSFCCLSP